MGPRTVTQLAINPESVTEPFVLKYKYMAPLLATNGAVGTLPRVKPVPGCNGIPLASWPSYTFSSSPAAVLNWLNVNVIVSAPHGIIVA